MNTPTILFYVIAAAVALGIVAAVVSYYRKLQALKARARFIQKYSFPAALRNQLQSESGLSLAQSGQVLEALKQYFLACLSAQRVNIGRSLGTSLGMPSKAVDDAWHQFILMTREYEKFCIGAFGEFLHHTPDVTGESSDKPLANTLHQLKRSALLPAGWAMVGAMPLLFALDRQLGIKDGHIYDNKALQDLDSQRKFLLASTSSSSSIDESPHWGSDSAGSSSDSGSSCSGGGSSCSGGGGGDS